MARVLLAADFARRAELLVEATATGGAKISVSATTTSKHPGAVRIYAFPAINRRRAS
jgi:hypothetical protein